MLIEHWNPERDTTRVIECYAATRTQEGRSTNEDAFLIVREPVFCAALADGAGNAERAAKRVLAQFEKLFTSGGKPVGTWETWRSWVTVLDTLLLDTNESTFLAAAVAGERAVGCSVGDSRAYFIDREGKGTILGSDGSKHSRLGSGQAVAQPIFQAMQPGDILVLLSDGAWTPLSPYVLTRTVVKAAAGHFSDVPNAVLDAASRTGRPDDMTVLAIRSRR